MRRTAPALSVAALAGAVVGFAASAAYADPAAEVSPGTVSPGGSVTVEVSCDPVDGRAPDTVDATSQAFEEGTVALKKVTGEGEKATAPAYRGTATVPPAENFEGDPDAAGAESAWTVDGACPAAAGEKGKPWSAMLTVARETAATHSAGADAEDGGAAAEGGTEGPDGGGAVEEHGTDGGTGGTDGGGAVEEHGTDGGTGGTSDTSSTGETGGWGGTGGTDAGGDTGGWGGTDGGGEGDQRHCTEPHAGRTEPGGTAPHQGGSAPHSGKGETHAEDCADSAVEHGVRAGGGGAFTDSVPALVAGGLLIAAALGGAAHRLYRRRSTGSG
ncbi:hypothetical protein ACFYNL_28810 [Streptomyces sp. NPDC007808]|uniref:hypothetical protein n=1 Tax=Streptomyces sp. NPDC007808 TaxID=3364779 RepID=UPI0036B11E45